jgi:DNA-binding XRE family transcriptional regulator
MKEPALFARKLREWRSENGAMGRMTQEELAQLLDVSVDAIGKYERSVSYIRGDLEPRLKDRLGWTRNEIIACRVDWTRRQNDGTEDGLRVLSDALVDELYGGSWKKAAEASLSLAHASFADLPDTLAPNDNVFVPFYESYRDFWSAVFRGNQMVAKWGITVLLPEDERRFRDGRLKENDLTLDRVRSTLLPGQYFGYCPVLIVKPGEEHAAAHLLSTFVKFLERLASRGVLFHGIGTVSVSPSGAQLCRDLGMDQIGHYETNPDFELWILSGAALAGSIFAQKSVIVSRAYTDAFL